MSIKENNFFKENLKNLILNFFQALNSKQMLIVTWMQESLVIFNINHYTEVGCYLKNTAENDFKYKAFPVVTPWKDAVSSFLSILASRYMLSNGSFQDTCYLVPCVKILDTSFKKIPSEEEISNLLKERL